MENEVNMIISDDTSKSQYTPGKASIQLSSLNQLISSLYSNMKDQTENLDLIATKALADIASPYPEIVISNGIEVLREYINEKVDTEERNVNPKILNIVNWFKQIFENNKTCITPTIYKSISNFIWDEVNTPNTTNTERAANISAVSMLWVYLADIYYDNTVSDLLNLFIPGVIPNKVVIELFTEIARTYPIQSSKKYQEVISRTLPILASIAKEKQRVIFSNFYSQISESIVITIDTEQIDNTSKSNIFEPIKNLFSTTYDMIYSQWNKEASYSNAKNRISVISSLIMIGTWLPENSIRNNIEDICLLFTSNLTKDKDTDNWILSKSFRIFLEVNLDRFKERLENCVDSILGSITSILNDYNISPNVVKFKEEFISLKKELFTIYFLWFKGYLHKAFPYLILQLDSIGWLEKLSCVWVSKTMLWRINSISNEYKDMLITAISKATHETDYELKSALFDFIYIWFEKGFIGSTLSDDHYCDSHTHKMISFWIKETGYTDEEVNCKEKEDYPFYTTKKWMRNRAENTLLDIIGKLKTTHKYFWPFIFETLCVKESDKSSYIICKIISKLKEELPAKEWIIDYQKYPGWPSCNRIIIKLFIILADPVNRDQLYSVSFKAIKDLLAVLYPNCCSSTNIELSEIEWYWTRCKYFEYSVYHEYVWCIWDKIWNDIKTPDLISWLSSSLNDYIVEYKNNTYVLCLLLIMQGVLLSKISRTEWIKNDLDNLMNWVHPEYKNETINGNIDASVPSDALRLGIGEAFGLASRNNNLDIVLDKINGIFKSEIQVKKATGFAAFFTYNTAPELSMEIVITLITCLGYIGKYSQTNVLSTRLNTNFLSHWDKHFETTSNNKGSLYDKLKFACVTAYGYLFKSLEKLSSGYWDKGEIFYLQKRDEYWASMLKVYTSEKKMTEIKIAALNNISYWIKWDPPITLDQCKKYIAISFSVFDMNLIDDIDDIKDNKALNAACNAWESWLAHETHSISWWSNNKDKVDDTEEIVADDFEFWLEYNKETMTTWDLFSYIIEKFVEKYSSAHLRSCADNPKKNKTKGENLFIKEYVIEKIQQFINSKKSVKFNREKDEFKNWSVSWIYLIFLVFDDSNKNSQGINMAITRWLTGISAYDVDFSCVESFNASLCLMWKEKLNENEYLKFILLLVKVCKTKIQSINNGISHWINCLIVTSEEYFKEKEGENTSENYYNVTSERSAESKVLSAIISTIINNLDLISQEDQSVTTQRFINLVNVTETVSKINLNVIVNFCLDEQFGKAWPVSLSSIIHNLSNDKTLITKIFTKITDIINNNIPGVNEIPNFQICRSTVFLGTMLETQNEIITPIIKKYIPQLLCTILLRIGSTHSINYRTDQFATKEEDPRNQTIWALQQLMQYFDKKELSTCLDSNGSIAKKLWSCNEYDEGVYELMTIFCKVSNDHNCLNAMFTFWSGFIDRQWKGQRVVVITCYAQFLNFASVLHIQDKDVDIIEWRNTWIEELTKMIMDADENARKMAIRGWGNWSQVYLNCTVEIDNYIILTSESTLTEDWITDEMRNTKKEEIKNEMWTSSYNSAIINLLIEKMADHSESVVWESLNSLQQMIEFLSMQVVVPCLSNLLLKLRPCFDSGNFNVRAWGFNVFNRVISLLNNRIDSKIEEIIRDQIHLHLISLMWHAIDEKPNVANNAMKTLIKALTIIVGEDFTKALDTSKEKFCDYDRVYEDFMKTICDRLVLEYASKINFHINNCIAHSLSTQDNIRAYSVYVISWFYDSIKREKVDYLATINQEKIFENFSKLITDYLPKVRIKVMKALKVFNDKLEIR